MARDIITKTHVYIKSLACYDLTNHGVGRGASKLILVQIQYKSCFRQKIYKNKIKQMHTSIGRGAFSSSSIVHTSIGRGAF